MVATDVADCVASGVDGGVDDGLTVLAAVNDGVRGGVTETAGVPDGDTDTDDVLLAEAVAEGVGEFEHDGYDGAVSYGAATTPRNTVNTGADASTVATLVAVLYAYSVVGEVAYSTKLLHPSDRPVNAMIMVPDSSRVPAGTLRVQAPEYVYSARLVLVSAAVSAIQMVELEDHTNPYGLYAYATALGTRLTPAPAVVGTVVPVENELRPPAGDGETDESVYMSAEFAQPHPTAPKLYALPGAAAAMHV